MANPTNFTNRAEQINRAIEDEVAAIRAAGTWQFPARDARIVSCYVNKIEGAYDVERAKRDTDNAIDLLYIAYNTTPQEEGGIRVKISGIMDNLIQAQQKSQRTMDEAMRTADHVLLLLKNTLPDWVDAKDDSDVAAAVKSFAGSDLLDVVKKVRGKALDLNAKLNLIAKDYDDIILQTTEATSNSEVVLGRRLKNKDKIEKEIRETNAERERLDSLVKDLQEDVIRFDKLARDYEARANTAEERAFIMQIVKVGAQMVSSVIPAVAMAFSGGSMGSALGSAARITSGETTGPKVADNTQEAIKTREDISRAKADREKADAKVKEAQTQIVAVRKSLREAEGVAESGDTDLDEAQPGEDVDKEGDSGTVREIKGRLKKAKSELEKNQAKSDKLAATLAALQASLDALSQGLGELSQEQKDSAASLREIQMKMLDKAESYEKERRTQAAELVKINALLTGKRTEEETIQLAIRSLNISLSALKRTKEIVVEIAFFFKSFADFMDQISREADLGIELLGTAAEKKKIGTSSLANLIEFTDAFFLKQAGEWHATYVVSEKFNACFSSGWTKLNKLTGKYITGDELRSYLETAAERLRVIAEEYEVVARNKIANLDRYRKELRGDSGAEATKTA
ncbi:coiled-coil domain-containing protein [Burkholderia ubonensis]|uniref:hypothetical protein n=1 Tax=Burkholderia ubonensis TaxID=101571 RepID=UPI002AAF7C5C|nr:hypothetical protein [Burkholderia ubonensis]